MTRDEGIAWCQKIAAGHRGENSEHTFDSGVEIIDWLIGAGVIGERILDIGCGNGRLAMALAHRQWSGSYLGLDPLKESIDFCARVFEDASAFRFEVLDIKNQYAPANTASPLSFRAPAGPFDTVFMCSVFTHLGTIEVATHYMKEIHSVLSGHLFSTWFSSPPNQVYEGEDRTVFAAGDIWKLLDAHAIIVSRGGQTTDYHDQLQVVSRT